MGLDQRVGQTWAWAARHEPKILGQAGRGMGLNFEPYHQARSVNVRSCAHLSKSWFLSKTKKNLSKSWPPFVISRIDYRELKVVDRIVQLQHREETMWRQRSRIQWLAMFVPGRQITENIITAYECLQASALCS
jgi:hypothetical protein